MRAIYYPFEKNLKSELISVKGEKLHHLLNVIRVKNGQEILLLNGKGARWKTRVVEIKRKEVLLAPITEAEVIARKNRVDLAVGKVKREALELVLRQCCELMVDKVIIFESEFSQRYKLNSERLDKLLISGIEQSNHVFKPALLESNFDEIPFEDYEQILYFSPDRGEQIKEVGKALMLIGPEGGLSQREHDFVDGYSKTKIIHLDTAILRTPTAVACAVGYLLGVETTLKIDAL